MQYVEWLNGETACRSRLSALTAEASRIMRARSLSDIAVRDEAKEVRSVARPQARG